MIWTLRFAIGTIVVGFCVLGIQIVVNVRKLPKLLFDFYRVMTVTGIALGVASVVGAIGIEDDRTAAIIVAVFGLTFHLIAFIVYYKRLEAELDEAELTQRKRFGLC